MKKPPALLAKLDRQRFGDARGCRAERGKDGNPQVQEFCRQQWQSLV
jgi:hypothetical protein